VARELRRDQVCFEKSNIKAGAPAQVYIGQLPVVIRIDREEMDLGLKAGRDRGCFQPGDWTGDRRGVAREGAQVAMCARTEKTLSKPLTTPQPDRRGDLRRGSWT